MTEESSSAIEILADIQKTLSDMTETLVDVVRAIDDSNRHAMDALTAIAKNVSRVR